MTNSTNERFRRLGGPSKKKVPFIITPIFNEYLDRYGRSVEIPLAYEDLLDFNNEIPLLDKNGNDTFWKTVFYPDWEMDRIHDELKRIYVLLEADGDNTIYEMDHLSVQRIDFCQFGNTKPFRVRIINHYNDNYDHFYVKQADSSRVYGLELEHLLSPNRIRYLVHKNTLIEDHIPGIPGDQFIEQNLDDEPFNQIRIAREFIKFNERCLVRLLGDMRAYNFVVEMTPDFEATQFRIRAIDFDQQSYEGSKNMYLPQFFKENRKLVKLVMKHMNLKTIKQYKIEERNLMAARAKTLRRRLNLLIDIMSEELLSFPPKIELLRHDLYRHYHRSEFLKCNSMGELLRTSIDILMDRDSRFMGGE